MIVYLLDTHTHTTPSIHHRQCYDGDGVDNDDVDDDNKMGHPLAIHNTISEHTYMHKWLSDNQLRKPPLGTVQV